MYTRSLAPPDRSFFLFGPRGTGKSTWLQQHFREARRYDLLKTSELLRLMKNPSLLSQEVAALPKGSWIVLDEIQKLPSLLDEVHALLFDHPGLYRFALTGSSARKLKKGGANLLAGRAINRSLFPLTGKELRFDFNPDAILRFGTLPSVLIESQNKSKIEILEAYAANYIREEIQQEALVKNLDSFSRFLDVAALMNGQVVNLAGIARDAGVARPTVQGYFDVLIDTLIGFRLPAWRPKAKVKEAQHSKFYFFDPGVVRALTGRLRDPLDGTERGPLLETIVLNELRAFIAYSGCGGELSYWRTPSGSEIDFIWTRGKLAIGIEVKSAARWKSEEGRFLRELSSSGFLKRQFAIYGGEHPLKDNGIHIYPLKHFMQALTAGEIIGD